MDVFLETGNKRAFAGAVDWPGWCRSGRDEESALRALVAYGTRYTRALQPAALDFRAPADVAALVVVERLPGDATTDFGAPGQPLARDSEPIDPAEPDRWEAILRACWDAFDSAADAARGHELRKGPRGGGRDLAKIREHIRDVDAGYLRSLGGGLKLSDPNDLDRSLAELRQDILTTLLAAVRGEIPERGPRGGAHWTPRYVVRRLAWHELDHAWEIEDRVV